MNGAGGGVGLWDRKCSCIFCFLLGGGWCLSFPFLFLLWTGWLSELDAGGCKETDKVGWVGGLVTAVGELVVNFFYSWGRGSLSYVVVG